MNPIRLAFIFMPIVLMTSQKLQDFCEDTVMTICWLFLENVDLYTPVLRFLGLKEHLPVNCSNCRDSWLPASRILEISQLGWL